MYDLEAVHDEIIAQKRKIDSLKKKIGALLAMEVVWPLVIHLAGTVVLFVICSAGCIMFAVAILVVPSDNTAHNLLAFISMTVFGGAAVVDWMIIREEYLGIRKRWRATHV